MRNFIRLSDKRIMTPTLVGMLGLDPENSGIMRQAAFMPVEYPYPQYDAMLETMEPDGEPEFDEENNRYVQKFQVLPLPEEALHGNVQFVAAQKANEARKAADDAVAPYMAEFSDVEKQTWAKQQAEVEAYLADESASTPTLDGLAQARGIEREKMLDKAIAKVTAFAPMSLFIVGKQQSYEDAIKALAAETDKTCRERIEELRLMEFDYSLPEAVESSGENSQMST